MATIRDVENAIQEIVREAIYPNGMSNPPIILNEVRIGNGWPVATQLDQDLLAGNAQITVFPVGMTDKNVTRFTQIWQESYRNLATLFINVVDNQITIDGFVTTPQAVLITLNGIDYGYEVLPTDTLNIIAANIAALIPGATSIANVITISGVIYSLRGVPVVTGSLALEYKRQIKLFYVCVFAPDYDSREILGDAVEEKLGANIYLHFADQTSAPIFYKGIEEIDANEKNIAYQRNIVWTVEYPSMIYSTGTEIQSIYATIN